MAALHASRPGPVLACEGSREKKFTPQGALDCTSPSLPSRAPSPGLAWQEEMAPQVSAGPQGKMSRGHRAGLSARTGPGKINLCPQWPKHRVTEFIRDSQQLWGGETSSAPPMTEAPTTLPALERRVERQLLSAHPRRSSFTWTGGRARGLWEELPRAIAPLNLTLREVTPKPPEGILSGVHGARIAEISTGSLKSRDPLPPTFTQRSSLCSSQDRPWGLPASPRERLTGTWRPGKSRAEGGKGEGRKGKGRRKTENVKKVKEERKS